MMQRMFQPNGLAEYPPFPNRLPFPQDSFSSWKPNVYPQLSTRSPFIDNPGFLPWPPLNRSRLDLGAAPFLYTVADFKQQLNRPNRLPYLLDFSSSSATTPFSPWTGCSVPQAAFNEFTRPRFHPYSEEEDLSKCRMLPKDATVQKKRVRRRRSGSPPKTVSSGDVAYHTERNKPLNDTSAMATYYEKETEADSSGCPEVKREPSLKRLLNISKQIAMSLPLREPVSVCAEADAPRPEVLPEEVSSDDSYELPPSLVIDLPEEDVPETCDLSPIPSPRCDADQLTVAPDLRLQSRSTSPHVQTTSQSSIPAARGPAHLSLASVVQKHPPEVRPHQVDVKPHHNTDVKQGKFRCQRCFLSFKSINMLIQHRVDCKSSPSGNSTDFTCKVCTKEFPTSKACSDHWEEYHSPARPYKCHTCGRRFTLDRTLDKHSWTHK